MSALESCLLRLVVAGPEEALQARGEAAEKQRRMQHYYYHCERVAPQEVTSSVEPAPKGEAHAKAQPRSEGERRKRGARPGHKGYGRKISMDIACEEVIHEVSEEDSVCSCCCESYVDMGVTEESIEIQGKILVTKSIRVRRRKVRKCNCEEAPKTVTALKPLKYHPQGDVHT